MKLVKYIFYGAICWGVFSTCHKFNENMSRTPIPSQAAKPAAPSYSCKNFGSYIRKVAPQNTGKWDVVLKASKDCYSKTKEKYFKDLVTRYTAKVAEQKKFEAERNKFIAIAGPEPIGAAAKSYISKIARDPSSLSDMECYKAMPSKNKSYWTQRCTFRGKNGFGGYVPQEVTVKIKGNVGFGHM